MSSDLEHDEGRCPRCGAKLEDWEFSGGIHLSDRAGGCGWDLSQPPPDEDTEP